MLKIALFNSKQISCVVIHTWLFFWNDLYTCDRGYLYDVVDASTNNTQKPYRIINGRCCEYYGIVQF